MRERDVIHPFWSGWMARELGEPFSYDQHPAWQHGWETMDETLSDLPANHPHSAKTGETTAPHHSGTTDAP